jgi:hypothetical protein
MAQSRDPLQVDRTLVVQALTNLSTSILHWDHRYILSKMPAIASAGPAVSADTPEFEKVNWRKMPNMRKLYWHACVLCIASATTGYDG